MDQSPKLVFYRTSHSTVFIDYFGNKSVRPMVAGLKIQRIMALPANDRNDHSYLEYLVPAVDQLTASLNELNFQINKSRVDFLVLEQLSVNNQILEQHLKHLDLVETLQLAEPSGQKNDMTQLLKELQLYYQEIQSLRNITKKLQLEAAVLTLQISSHFGQQVVLHLTPKKTPTPNKRSSNPKTPKVIELPFQRDVAQEVVNLLSKQKISELIRSNSHYSKVFKQLSEQRSNRKVKVSGTKQLNLTGTEESSRKEANLILVQ